MGTVAQNLATWDHHYAWSAQGDEWSREWGGASAQWHGSLLPRLRHFLPAGTVLEIAPGFGRWTQFLAPLSQRLVVVDLSSSCIDACRHRFGHLDHIDYHVNDGRSLDMIEDGALDVVFTFDSLVHVESDVIRDYLEAMQRKLGRDGVGFIHHSNLAEYADEFALEATMSDEDFARQGRQRPPSHWRAASMSAHTFRELATAVDLRCVGQEIVNWGGERLIDCISLVTLPGSRWDREVSVERNPHFMNEARSIRIAAHVFGPTDDISAHPSPDRSTNAPSTTSEAK